MTKTVFPTGYHQQLSYIENGEAIKFVKDTFEASLRNTLNLTRVSAPLFVDVKTGLNDNLNGTEYPVEFSPSNAVDLQLQIIQSLAKWKRHVLAENNFKLHSGIYADMNAIRKDEVLDNIHSLYVDQWDWEVVISTLDRNVRFLKNTVDSIYQTILEVELAILIRYPFLVDSKLPKKIKHITTQELLDMYPNKTPREREKLACEQYGAIFLMKIGKRLSDGETHDKRAPDYDDWELNGDIIVWNATLEDAFELSSMGIRVNNTALERQVKLANREDLLELPYHQMILAGEYPYTIGGGIGQSRLCMYFLRKAHIGEVQSSVWDQETIDACNKHHIKLL